MRKKDLKKTIFELQKKNIKLCITLAKANHLVFMEEICNFSFEEYVEKELNRKKGKK